jgi:hypothetical protein
MTAVAPVAVPQLVASRLVSPVDTWPHRGSG